MHSSSRLEFLRGRHREAREAAAEAGKALRKEKKKLRRARQRLGTRNPAQQSRSVLKSPQQGRHSVAGPRHLWLARADHGGAAPWAL